MSLLSGSPQLRTTDVMTIQEKAEVLYKGKEMLAPMVRASTTPLRTLALIYGADVVFSEEIVDRSIINCHRVENQELGTVDYVRKQDAFSEKQLRKMKKKRKNGDLSSSLHVSELPVVLRIVPSIEQGRFVYQIGTGEPELALPAALMVEKDVSAIDINMGCPKKFSVSGGMGSALLSDVKRACDIVKTLRRNVLSIPVSAKIRLLKDTKSTIDFVKALEDAGVCAVTIHARQVGDEPTSRAKWDALEPVVHALNVPTVINGDLYTREDIRTMKLQTGADSVMLARPALYNTSIFRSDESGGGESALLPKHVVVQEYLREAVRWRANPKNVKYVVCEMMTNRRAPLHLQAKLPQKYPRNQTINKVCQCKTTEELCKLWDVSLYMTSHVSMAADTPLAATEQRYDNMYFLDPEKFRKVEIEDQSVTTNGDGNGIDFQEGQRPSTKHRTGTSEDGSASSIKRSRVV